MILLLLLLVCSLVDLQIKLPLGLLCLGEMLDHLVQTDGHLGGRVQPL